MSQTSILPRHESRVINRLCGDALIERGLQRPRPRILSTAKNGVRIATVRHADLSRFKK